VAWPRIKNQNSKNTPLQPAPSTIDTSDWTVRNIALHALVATKLPFLGQSHPISSLAVDDDGFIVIVLVYEYQDTSNLIKMAEKMSKGHYADSIDLHPPNDKPKTLTVTLRFRLLIHAGGPFGGDLLVTFWCSLTVALTFLTLYSTAICTGHAERIDVIEIITSTYIKYGLSCVGWGLAGAVGQKADELRWIPGQRSARYDIAGFVTLTTQTVY